MEVSGRCQGLSGLSVCEDACTLARAVGAEPPPGDSPNATPSRWPGKRAAGGIRLLRPATSMQIRNANTPAQMRLALTKRLRQKPTKGFGRRLSVSIACMFWVGRRQQPASLVRAALVASSRRSFPSRLPAKVRRQSQASAANLCPPSQPPPSCARSCCHCTQPVLCPVCPCR